jgi:hypothetical protein
MTKKVKVPRANRGFGYVGVWDDGDVGWWLPEQLSGPDRLVEPISVAAMKFAEGERFFLCEITVTPRLDKRGRPITRIIREK